MSVHEETDIVQRGEPSEAEDVDFYVVDFKAKHASGLSSVYEIQPMFLSIMNPQFNRIVLRQEIIDETIVEDSQDAEKRGSVKGKKGKKAGSTTSSGGTSSGGTSVRPSGGTSGGSSVGTSAGTSKGTSDKTSGSTPKAQQGLGGRKGWSSSDSGLSMPDTITLDEVALKEKKEKENTEVEDVKDVLNEIEFEIVGKVKISNGDAASDKEVIATISCDRGK